MPIQDDFSIAANGDIRYTGDGTYCYQITAIDTANNEFARSNKAEAIVNTVHQAGPLNLTAGQ